MKITRGKTWLAIREFKDFLDRTEIKFIYFFLPLLLSLGAAFFEGISISLLIPLLKGIFEMDYSFVKGIPVIKFILDTFPQAAVYPNVIIFGLLVGIIFISAVVKNILLYLANINLAYRVRQFSHNLRKTIFSRYLSFGKLYFDQNNTGNLLQILMGFTNTIARMLMDIQQVFSIFFMLIIYLIIMCAISWKLTLGVMIFFPIFNYSLKWLIERIKSTSSVQVNFSQNLYKRIFNVISCIPLIKAYSWEEKEKEKFALINADLRDAEFNLDKKFHLVGPIQEILTLITILLFTSVISFLLVKEKVGEVASFLVFFYLIRKIITSFHFLNNFKTAIARESGSIVKIKEVYDDQNKFFVQEGKEEFKGLERNIEFRNLTFSYIKEVPILKNITFSIEKGKVTAIVGPTGAGKTTLINLILRFYDCSPSMLLIDGVDIREFTLKSLRKYMALVSQDVLLFNDTLKNNITYGLDSEISEEALVEIAKKARLYDFIMRLPRKFDTYIGDRGIKLSGGEKQRVSIARALLKKAEILILDEATSSLDTRTEKRIQEAIAEVIKGRTTIVIAHRLSTIRNADKIVVIEKGKFIEEGSLEELLKKKGKFYQYWQEQKFY